MKKTEPVSYKDDFYESVNHNWLLKTKLPSDKSIISSFSQIHKKIENKLIKLSDQWLLDSSPIQNESELIEFIKYYQMLLDTTKREELGFEPLRKYLNKIEELKSFYDINDKYLELRKLFISLPFDMSVEEDFLNPQKYTLWFSEMPPILGSVEMYDNPKTEHFLKVYKKVMTSLLINYGKSRKEANLLVKQALRFDQHILKFILTAKQKVVYTSLYNPIPVDNINQFSDIFNLNYLIKNIVNNPIEEIIVTNPLYLKKLNEIFNANTFEDYKAFLLLSNFLSNTSLLSESIRKKASIFFQTLQGSKKATSMKKFAFQKASKSFSMPFGVYYAKKFFGEKGKKNIESMIQNMIQVYKKRLLSNEWLTKATIDKAIYKLEKLDVLVGYPDVIQPYYSQLKTKTYEEGFNIVDNNFEWNKIILKYSDSLYNKKSDKRLWSMAPNEVNAYFNPLKNHIVFPAGILQNPMYDVKQNSSANYGGIGAVIAHEISHAFDNNGAKFNAEGQMENWWSQKDVDAFLLKQKQVIELYDKLETINGPVDGTLTVSENIADVGGFACALEAASLEKDYNPKAFFESWVTIWRNIVTEELAKKYLKTDPHSPMKVRGNRLLQNSDIFHEIYQIQKTDKMFLDKTKRVKVW